MKKYILPLVVLLAAILASSNVVFAQTDNNDRCEIRSLKSGSPMARNTREASSCAEWGTFTNFSATDMNGVTHDIQSYLNQGKYVVIEFFCAWCGPCWQYYQGGTLEELYNTYGDGGTGEFVVLMVEGELTNTEAQITGTSTSEDYAGMSQGDFTNGGTNPVPIIDATENLVENVSLYEGYVPSVYLFCPAGYVFDIFTNDQLTANEIYNFATRTCPTEESLPDIGIAKPVVVRMGETVTFSSCVVSLTDVTYAWTFEDGTPETSTDAIVDVVWDTPGMHRISLTVANVNGQVEHPDSVYVIDCSSGISTFPFVEDFESGQGCWTLESANTVNEITIGEYSNGMNGLIFSSYDQANNYNQYFISPELHHTGELNLSFKYKKDGSQSTGENFYVKYSTTTSDISSFITLGSMITTNSNSWETYTGTLPADAKYFMINYTTTFQYYLVVDDLTIERAAYWTCDFEGDEMWSFGNDQQDGNVQWQIVTPETYPEMLVTSDVAYLKPFVYQGDTLCNTPDHWAMVDLVSQHEQFGGPGQVAESSYIEFRGIDLSESEHPQLRFNQIYRRLNSVETLIRVSTDGGDTWTDHIVNENIDSNEYGRYAINKGISIYEAVGQENVIIHFQMNGDGTALQGYGWEIDDIEIVETPQCDFTLKEARISMFGYIDYRNVPDDFLPTITDPDERRETAYQFYEPYAQSPRKQWTTESGYAAFNVEVSSYGYDTVMPMARVKITNPNGVEIYNKVASGIRALSTNESDTVDFFNSDSFYFEGIESYHDIITGRYTVDFYVFADGMEDADESDNHTTQYFDITDNIFSMSYDEPTGYTDFNRYTVSSSGDEYGISFTYSYQPEGNIVVDAYIDEHTTVGTMAQTIIYEYNDNGVPVEVASSDTMIITSDMLGSWVNFPLNNVFNAVFDTKYLVAIKGMWNTGDTFAVGTSDVLTSKGYNCYMRLPSYGDTWYYNAPRLAIRVRESSEITDSTVHWSCDFEGDEIWTFGNEEQDGNVQWQIVTLETYPATLVTSEGAYLKPFVYQGDTLCDTPEHWAMVDLISQHVQLGGPGQVMEKPYIEFRDINLSNAEHPEICIKQIYRRINNVETIIKVSTDGGATWTDHVVNADVPTSNEYGEYYIFKGIPIFEAAGQRNVTIRFQMNGDERVLNGAAQGYGWEIDDIVIKETPANDLALKDARISMFGYTDYRDEDLLSQLYPGYSSTEARQYAYQTHDPYAQSPRQQWATENGYAAFNVEVSSYGYDTVMPMARVKITNPNGVEICNKVSSGIRALSTNESDTVDFFNSASFYFEGIESYEDIIIGRYTVDFYVFADGMDDADESDNHTTQYFDITDNTFSMSYDEPTGYSDFNRYTVSSSGDEYGISFTYSYQPERKITVDAYIDEHTTVGTMAQAIIYEYNGDVYPSVEVGCSDTLVITSDMLGSWVSFLLNYHVNSDSTFFVAIRGIWNDGETFAVGTSDVLTSIGHNCYMHFLSQGDLWYYAGPQLAIRLRDSMEADIVVLSSNEAYGSVSGGGSYNVGDTIMLMAMPNGGYLFDSWEDDNFDNPRTVTVTSDSTFIADFIKCEITQTIDTVVPNFVTIGDHTFYSTGDYTFAVSPESACDTIYDIRLRVLAEPVYDIGPNPTKSLLNINSDGFISVVEFYTTTGQLALRKEVNGYEAEFDVERLMNGVYIVRIYGEESTLPSVYKIVKE